MSKNNPHFMVHLPLTHLLPLERFKKGKDLKLQMDTCNRSLYSVSGDDTKDSVVKKSIKFIGLLDKSIDSFWRFHRENGILKEDMKWKCPNERNDSSREHFLSNKLYTEQRQ